MGRGESGLCGPWGGVWVLASTPWGRFQTASARTWMIFLQVFRGQISRGRMLSRRRGSPMQRLRSRKVPEACREQRVKRPPHHCSVLLSRSEPGPALSPPIGQTKSGRGRPEARDPQQVSALFLLPTPDSPAPPGFCSRDTEALYCLAMARAWSCPLRAGFTPL